MVFGQHVMPRPVGTVDISSGPVAAMADSLRVTVHGQQSHGSQPQDSIDPIVMAAHMVTRLQGIVSRELDPRKSAVVTVGTFHAGLKENIIPASVEFTLNIRTFDEDVRSQVLAAVRRIIVAEAAASGAPQPDIEEMYRFPQCFNDPDAVPSVVEALRLALGTEAVEITPPMMGSEDFGHLGTAIGVPSVFWMFGGTPQPATKGQAPSPSTTHRSSLPSWKGRWQEESLPPSPSFCPGWATELHIKELHDFSTDRNSPCSPGSRRSPRREVGGGPQPGARRPARCHDDGRPRSEGHQDRKPRLRR